MRTLNLTESEVNELRFMLSNLNSPSRSEALELAEVWKIKLTIAARKMHPVAVDQSVNVN